MIIYTKIKLVFFSNKFVVQVERRLVGDLLEVQNKPSLNEHESRQKAVTIRMNGRIISNASCVSSGRSLSLVWLKVLNGW